MSHAARSDRSCAASICVCMSASFHWMAWWSRDGRAERAPVLRVAHALLERGARDADGLRADADAPAVERHHRDLEAFVLLAEQRVAGDAAIRRTRAAPCSSRGCPSCPRASRRAARARPPRRGSTRCPRGPARRGGAVRAHTMKTRGGAPARDPLLAAAEDPAAPVASRRRRHRARIAARVGLAQREAAQPAMALREDRAVAAPSARPSRSARSSRPPCS